MKQLLYLFCTLMVTSCSGQKKDDFLIKSRENAKKVNHFLNQNDDYGINSKILFSIADSLYIVIANKEKEYIESIVEFKSSIDKISLVTQKTIKKPNSILDKGFNLDNYRKDFISFNSYFYKDGYDVASGHKTYFVLIDETNERMGEAILSVMVKPNPIDSKLYGYLASKLINLPR